MIWQQSKSRDDTMKLFNIYFYCYLTSSGMCRVSTTSLFYDVRMLTIFHSRLLKGKQNWRARHDTKARSAWKGGEMNKIVILSSNEAEFWVKSVVCSILCKPRLGDERVGGKSMSIMKINGTFLSENWHWNIIIRSSLIQLWKRGRTRSAEEYRENVNVARVWKVGWERERKLRKVTTHTHQLEPAARKNKSIFHFIWHISHKCSRSVFCHGSVLHSPLIYN